MGRDLPFIGPRRVTYRGYWLNEVAGRWWVAKDGHHVPVPSSASLAEAQQVVDILLKENTDGHSLAHLPQLRPR